jgi:pimeloyl-ACP methyl ester carboxylesterase
VWIPDSQGHKADDAVNLKLLLLHALPLDGSMWARQIASFPGRTYAPTLYQLGNSIEAWAAGALKLTGGDRLIVVGCSVGGSCALEIAAMVPERIAALVLIGTKARHKPDPELRRSVVWTVREKGVGEAWNVYWEMLFSPKTSAAVVGEAKRIALSLPPEDIACGVSVFHSRASRDDVLAAFPNPVVLVTGADDVAPGPQTSSAQARSAKQGRLHIVPDCGHYVPMEQPDILNSILRALISELD